MSASLDTRPKATTPDLEDLVDWAWSGQIRVPHFQRPLRWQRLDVIRLFDSIVRGYPVGSLLLWRRPAAAEEIQLGPLRIDAPETSEALWVVDGQQRITSLASALHPNGAEDSRFALAYDLRTEQFVSLPPVEDPMVVPLPVLFDLTKVLRWFAQFPEASEHVVRANEITKTLRQFKIPAYEVVQHDAKVLQDIFDRMNNYGKRLSRAEIFSSLFAGSESRQDSAPTLDRIAQSIDDDLGFGLIDNDTVLQAVLARRGPDVKREIRNEFGGQDGLSHISGARHTGRAIIEFPGEDRDTAYMLGEKAMRRAVHFLQHQAGVPHFTMLPYRHLLVALTRLFAHHPNPGNRHLQLLRRWFWRAAVVGPEIFKGSTTGAIRATCYAIHPDDLSRSIDELLTQVNRPDAPLPDLRRFRSNEAATKILLCSWWSSEPRSLESTEFFGLEELSTRLQDRPTALDAVRYVVSRYSIPREYRLWAADRVLMPTTENEVGSVEGLLTPSQDTDEESWRKVLKSHHISEEMLELLKRGETVEFLKARQQTLREELTTFLAARCEWLFENTPPLAELVMEDVIEEPNDTLF